MTRQELEALLKRNPQIKLDENYNRTKLPPAKPERTSVPALDSSPASQVPSLGRARVSITFYRVRKLDPDNVYGSAKALLDGLQQAGLIAGDSEKHISLEVKQEKVKAGRRNADRDRV